MRLVGVVDDHLDHLPGAVGEHLEPDAEADEHAEPGGVTCTKRSPSCDALVVVDVPADGGAVELDGAVHVGHGQGDELDLEVHGCSLSRCQPA